MFNPKDHIYNGYPRPYCMGQSDGNRKCPVCGKGTDSMLPTHWWSALLIPEISRDETTEFRGPYMAFFCKKHGPKDLEGSKK